MTHLKTKEYFIGGFVNFGGIISNSFKYPFKDLKKLGFICLLFVLLLILPVGILIFKNSVSIVIGVACLLIFILITPGYNILVIKSGIEQSNRVPSVKVGRSIINTLKLLVLYICYIAIPSIITFTILMFATGLSNYPMAIFTSTDLNSAHELISGFLNAILITLIVTSIVRFIFSLVSYIAKARLANSNSLIEALKINKVIRDIRKIGLLKFIGWYLIMGILLAIVGAIALLVLFVPYVGFIIYLCIVVPIIYLVYNYSLGLLYSDLSDGKHDGDDDLEKFEREIKYLKYGLYH